MAGELVGDGVGLTESYTQVDGRSPANAGTKKDNSGTMNHLEAVLIIIKEATLLTWIFPRTRAFICINRVPNERLFHGPPASYTTPKTYGTGPDRTLAVEFGFSGMISWQTIQLAVG